MNTINNLQISYPDFQLNTIIDPEQMDTNNLELVTKINAIIAELNSVNATKVPLTPITDLTGTDVQTVMQSLKNYIDGHKGNNNNPHNVTPAQLNVYTKEELAPFIKGGDTVIRYDVFTIVNSNLGDGTFTYSDKNGSVYIGTVSPEGYQTFTLLSGSYVTGQNRIECIVNDALTRSVASGGLIETSSTTVTLTAPEGNGSELTFKYYERIGITGTGTIVMGDTQPPKDFFWFKVVS